MRTINILRSMIINLEENTMLRKTIILFGLVTVSLCSVFSNADTPVENLTLNFEKIDFPHLKQGSEKAANSKAYRFLKTSFDTQQKKGKESQDKKTAALIKGFLNLNEKIRASSKVSEEERSKYSQRMAGIAADVDSPIFSAKDPATSKSCRTSCEKEFPINVDINLASHLACEIACIKTH